MPLDDQRDPDVHRGDGVVTDAPRRELRHIAPTERISPDWWHTPSMAPTATVTVADTARFQEALEQVARDWPSRNVTAQLLADPDDPDDRHAVVVLLDGYQVGRLGPDRDPRFPAIVRHLGRTQRSVRVRARMIDRPAPDDAEGTRGLLLFAHPECFDATRHLLAGDRLVDVRPGLDALALVADLPQHEPFAVELVDLAERIVVVQEGADPASPLRPGVTDPSLGTLAPHLEAALRPVLRSAAARGVRPTCLASWSADVTGRPFVRLHLVDRPDLLHDVCGPGPASRFDHIG